MAGLQVRALNRSHVGFVPNSRKGSQLSAGSSQEMLDRAVQEIAFLKRRQKLAKNVIRAHESKCFFLEELLQRAAGQGTSCQAAEAVARVRAPTSHHHGRPSRHSMWLC